MARRAFSILTIYSMVCIALAVLAGALPGCAAEPYPTHPVRMIVPHAAGGNADTTARYVAKRLTEHFGQQFFVDNRPGASSIIGTDLAARAPADGYNLLYVADLLVSNPSLATLPYDTLKDLAPISLLSSTPMMIVTNPGLPVSNVKQLIELAKRRPGQLNYASSGHGNESNLAGAMFNIMAGVNIVHVPYKATAAAIIGVMGNEAQIGYPTIIAAEPFVKSGKLKALAMTTKQRSSLMPDLPTVSESGLPDFEASIWVGLLAPSATPKEIVTRLNDAVAQILKSTEARDWYSKMGADVFYRPPAEFGAFIRSEIIKWEKIIRESGIRVDLKK